MNIALQTAGVATQGAGLLILFLHWRAERGFGGVALVGSWALILLGGAPWLLHVSPERGLALAVLAPMIAGLLLLAPDGISRMGAGARRRKKSSREEAKALDTNDAAPGRLSRNIARWLGSLFAAPVFALAAAACWQAFFLGTLADRIAFSIFALILAWTGATLWLLAAMRPWIAALTLTIAALALGGGAYAFANYGAA